MGLDQNLTRTPLRFTILRCLPTLLEEEVKVIPAIQQVLARVVEPDRQLLAQQALLQRCHLQVERDATAELRVPRPPAPQLRTYALPLHCSRSSSAGIPPPPPPWSVPHCRGCPGGPAAPGQPRPFGAIQRERARHLIRHPSLPLPPGSIRRALSGGDPRQDAVLHGRALPRPPHPRVPRRPQ